MNQPFHEIHIICVSYTSFETQTMNALNNQPKRGNQNARFDNQKFKVSIENV